MDLICSMQMTTSKSLQWKRRSNKFGRHSVESDDRWFQQHAFAISERMHETPRSSPSESDSDEDITPDPLAPATSANQFDGTHLSTGHLQTNSAVAYEQAGGGSHNAWSALQTLLQRQQRNDISRNTFATAETCSSSSNDDIDEFGTSFGYYSSNDSHLTVCMRNIAFHAMYI